MWETYFVNSVLQCIFHTLLLRGVIVEYGLKILQHHEFYGSQSTIQKVHDYELHRKIINNIGHIIGNQLPQKL